MLTAPEASAEPAATVTKVAVVVVLHLYQVAGREAAAADVHHGAAAAALRVEHDGRLGNLDGALGNTAGTGLR